MLATLGNLLRALLPQPKAYGDYYTVHGWLIYKKLVAMLLAGLFILLLAFGIWMSMWLHARQADAKIPVFYIRDEALKAYTGQAILVDLYQDVLYQGAIAQGQRAGQGTAFEPTGGEVVYEGGFLEDQYSGVGRAYRQGWLLYEGAFAQGLYSGAGTLYASAACIQYCGQFAGGVYQGPGVLYHADGQQALYDGAFAAGLYEGAGILYRADGTVRYEGDFHRGLFHGAGTEYTEKGAVVYEGAFKNGLRDGAGSLYSADGMRPVFQGQFIRGEPARNGKLFNRQGQLLYDGAIYNGLPDYLSLLGLPMTELGARVAELPVIYYEDGHVGYLYRELGFAVLCDDAAISERVSEEPQEARAPFAPPQDHLVADMMMVIGARIWEQVPFEQGVSVSKRTLTGFEAFLESRVAGIEDPTARLTHKAEALHRGNRLYEVVGSGPPVAYGGVGRYLDAISYYYRSTALEKGAIPAVVVCSKAQLGG